MTERRFFMAAMAVFAIALATGGTALAAVPLVEIVAMPHPPVVAALKPLREWLARQGSKVRVKEIDIESPEGVKRLQSVSLSGHVPVLILIDGKHSVTRKNGSKVAFANFPNVENTPAGARGEWTIADVQAVLTERLR